MNIVFTPQQVAIIGLVATVLLYVLNWLAEKAGVKIGRAALTVVLFVLAYILAGLFNPDAVRAVITPVAPFPVMPGNDGTTWGAVAVWLMFMAAWLAWLANYLTAVVVGLAPMEGVATAIYNTLGKYLMDGSKAKISDVVTWLADAFGQDKTPPDQPAPPSVNRGG